MKLTEYLKRNRLTQAEFGRRLNPPMTQAHLSHILSGRSRISLARALEIQAVTGGEVPVTEWVERPNIANSMQEDTDGISSGTVGGHPDCIVGDRSDKREAA